VSTQLLMSRQTSCLMPKSSNQVVFVQFTEKLIRSQREERFPITKY
jgi:hypothetical protein